MQQYFSEMPLRVGAVYEFTKEQAHHAGTVLRLNGETVRLVSGEKGYFATVHCEGKKVYAVVDREDERYNELPVRIILCMALIRREKMEFVLQKAAELGVSDLIPFESSRCVVHVRPEKSGRQMERWNTILLEASAQCKRNRIPTLHPAASFRDILKVQADARLAAYENAYGKAGRITDHLQNAGSVAVVIGPEGGFSPEEMDALCGSGFASVTLGSRILRAETAALYACSVIGEYFGD